MIRPVSFGSTYNVFVTKANVDRNVYSFPKLADYCGDNNIKYNFSLQTEEQEIPGMPGLTKTVPRFDDSINDYVYCQYTIVAPDSEDKSIEKICSNLGVKFTKYNTDEVSTVENIKSRIVLPELHKNDKYLVNVDADRLREILKYQSDNNFAQCEEMYNKFYKQDVQFMMKSGNKIIAPSLYIEETKEGTLKEIPKLQYIPGNSFSFKLIQETDKPEHCIYAALQQMGLKEIPVAVDKETYKIGNELFLFK